MADNVQAEAVVSGGATFAADDIGGVLFPRTKLVIGGDGTNDGDVASGNPLPVTGTVTANAGTNLDTSALALESGGNLAGAATSLAVLDDWDESDRAKVNLIVGQAGIAAGTGTDGATVPRVTLATNVPLPAGTNAIGKLSANSGVDIGDVDVTSVSGNVTVVQGTAANLAALASQGTAAAATAGWPIIFGRPTSAALSAASVSCASSGENTLVSGTGGQTIRVFKIFLVAAAAVDIKFKDAASGTDLTGAMSLSAGGSFVLDFDGDPWLTTATAGALILNLSTNVQVSGRVYYIKS